MATQASIITEVKSLIQDTEYSSTDILTTLNEGQSKIAGGTLLRYPDGTQVKTSPLPDLAMTASLTTSTTYPYISLPSDYGRDMYFLASTTNSIEVELLGSLAELLGFHSALNSTSRVSMAAISGIRLYYQGIPGTAEVLTAYYYRKPYDMETYSAITISFTGTTNIISDSASGLSVFYKGQTIDVTGSTSNNSDYTITDVESDGSAMTVSESLTTEAAGDTVVIKSRPDGIPAHLHESLLVNYAAMKIFERQSIRDETNTPSAEKCAAFFNRAMLDFESVIEVLPTAICIKV